MAGCACACGVVRRSRGPQQLMLQPIDTTDSIASLHQQRCTGTDEHRLLCASCVLCSLRARVCVRAWCAGNPRLVERDGGAVQLPGTERLEPHNHQLFPNCLLTMSQCFMCCALCVRVRVLSVCVYTLPRELLDPHTHRRPRWLVCHILVELLGTCYCLFTRRFLLFFLFVHITTIVTAIRFESFICNTPASQRSAPYHP